MYYPHEMLIFSDFVGRGCRKKVKHKISFLVSNHILSNICKNHFNLANHNIFKMVLFVCL